MQCVWVDTVCWHQRGMFEFKEVFINRFTFVSFTSGKADSFYSLKLTFIKNGSSVFKEQMKTVLQVLNFKIYNIQKL